jgi:uncharacterized protein YkwD
MPLFWLKNYCVKLYPRGKCAKLTLMKQKILLPMFALSLLLIVSSKQIFALGENPTAAQDLTPTATPETAVHMTERINDYRTEQGLPAYYYDQKLAEASQRLVDTMTATEFISHYDHTGANPQQRAEAAGYDEHVTEIIYGGFGSADAAWDWWVENELHHELLTSEDYIEFGVATAVSEQSGRQYWAVMFGTGDGQYETADQTNNHENAGGVVTKLPPATSTTEVTAVAATSTATQPDPTATTEQVAAVTEDTPANPAPTNGKQGTRTTPTTGASGVNSFEETRWLIIAAVVTIIIGIAVFYFPRHGLSQKFKERT